MCTWNAFMVDGTEGKKYPVIYMANQIKQHLVYLHSTFLEHLKGYPQSR